MTTIDLATLTEQEMKEAGWVQLGTRKDPHWQRRKGKGVENYFNNVGRRSTTSSTAAGSQRVSNVVITATGWRTIQSVLNQYEDSETETGGCLLCSRDGDTIYVHEMSWPHVGDYRTVDAMQVRDGAGFAMEEARQNMGIEWVYGGLLHTHPRGGTTPSIQDELAFSVRARKSLGDTFTALIVAPRDHEFGRSYDQIGAYVCQKINGQHRTVPVGLTIEQH
jgi:hypothetical protein